MIDFDNGSVFKLKPTDVPDSGETVSELLVAGESFQAAFSTVRDKVLFTDKRIIAVNVQGITGKKVDYTTLPYSRIQAFSVETAGTFDMDAELDLWFSGMGKIRFEFKGGADIRALANLIASHTL
ncbi:PH domain-containing protein [Haloglycomyces albus]|uniref:PH domain-containing protein n=1 Tax=Haloglycomyces albus TaxID=526067 RepID=UPI00046D2CD3|nr:PH domain-containing protein [Haloglycomyces albus]